MAKKDKSDGRKKREAALEGAETPLSTALIQTARAVRNSLAHQLAATGLYAGQDALIVALSSREGQAPGAIAQHLGVRAPTITKTINRLVSQGFVEKRGSEKDGRKAEIYLTAKGREVVSAIEAANRQMDRTLAADLSGKEIKALLKLLRRMEESLHEAPPRAD